MEKLEKWSKEWRDGHGMRTLSKWRGKDGILVKQNRRERWSRFYNTDSWSYWVISSLFPSSKKGTKRCYLLLLLYHAVVWLLHLAAESTIYEVKEDSSRVLYPLLVTRGTKRWPLRVLRDVKSDHWSLLMAKLSYYLAFMSLIYGSLQFCTLNHFTYTINSTKTNLTSKR